MRKSRILRHPHIHEVEEVRSMDGLVILRYCPACGRNLPIRLTTTTATPR